MVLLERLILSTCAVAALLMKKTKARDIKFFIKRGKFRMAKQGSYFTGHRSKVAFTGGATYLCPEG